MINDSEKILKIIDDLQGDDRLIASPKVCYGIMKIREIIEASNSEKPNSSEPKQADPVFMDDTISRKTAIDALGEEPEVWTGKDEYAQGLNNQWHYDVNALKALPSAQPETHEKRTETHACDLIDREAAVDAIYHHLPSVSRTRARTMLHEVPSAQPEQRYTEEELMVFKHGISLSLLSKRSSQHWQYDEDTATEIKFLERLYEKVSADMRGEQDG